MNKADFESNQCVLVVWGCSMDVREKQQNIHTQKNDKSFDALDHSKSFMVLARS